MEISHDNLPAEDLSQSDELFWSVVDQVGFLRGTLEGFTDGRTDSLRGARTRDALSQSLYRLDETLKKMQQLRKSPAPRLNQFVTAAMREKIQQAASLSSAVMGLLLKIDEDLRERGVRGRPTVRAMDLQQLVGINLEQIAGMMGISDTDGTDELGSGLP